MASTGASGMVPEKVEVVVVDANAVIHHSGGKQLTGMLPVALRQKALEGKLKLVTLPEVVAEIRDKKAREALAPNNMLFDLETREPTEEAVAAVTRFAKLTGDIHVLSSVDMKLVALAYDMEHQVLRSVAHLRTFPMASSLVENTSRNKVQVKMPGWDPEDNHDEEWGSKQEEGEGGEGSAPAKSKIFSSDFDGNAMEVEEAQTEAAGEEAKASARSEGGSSPAAAGAAPASDAAAAVANETDEADEAAEDDDDGWETARKSKNAQRKHKRKALRRMEREQEQQRMETEALEAAPAPAPASTANGVTSSPSASDQGHGVGAGAGGAPLAPAVESPVVSLTGDFAMQNVLLQMGLQVAGPKDGMLIKEARAFGLRCHACGWSTENPQELSNDLFCPKCGNMGTLERCQVVVDSNGQKTFLQLNRKRQTLRGTKYSIPFPQTGRNAKNPILREDSLKMPKRKLKQNMDAFAPEYNEETWHMGADTATKGNKGDLAKQLYLEQVKQSTRKNPNARRLTRTNRRR